MLNDRTKFILKIYIEGATTLFSLVGAILEIVQIQDLGKLNEVPANYIVAVHIASKTVKMDAQSFGRLNDEFILLYYHFLLIDIMCAHISILHLEFLKLFHELLVIYVSSFVHFLDKVKSLDKIWILVLWIVFILTFLEVVS